MRCLGIAWQNWVISSALALLLLFGLNDPGSGLVRNGVHRGDTNSPDIALGNDAQHDLREAPATVHKPRIVVRALRYGYLVVCLLVLRVRYPSADPQVVFPTYPPRYPLVQAGRDSWRQDVRTLIVTEGATERAVPSPLGDVPSETWWEYPDDTRTELNVYKKGDMKLAASFRIANETFGDTYEYVVVV